MILKSILQCLWQWWRWWSWLCYDLKIVKVMRLMWCGCNCNSDGDNHEVLRYIHYNDDQLWAMITCWYQAKSLERREQCWNLGSYCHRFSPNIILPQIFTKYYLATGFHQILSCHRFSPNIILPQVFTKYPLSAGFYTILFCHISSNEILPQVFTKYQFIKCFHKLTVCQGFSPNIIFFQ